ncbi:Mg2+ transporter protein CorA-like/Zinc transport protein ZntB [Penicillium taxi]|uniref:Mg2+ transporter protein CorA-like/Zinc transport protein ZntB n=1 Tax=Penicillium taxi TaxID=168475 RepID=UPI002545740E|nr:Mg2+ transporter protein CorA-like/Zinc transport protein ZntB [Penicillium taxi]KAJ5899209.1 Mg2+ transporter protein CorA-like/Zinc transport protein ZntB [Penicillium taxi]
MSYTLRYPECKDANKSKWVIRQSGVYHRYNTKTFQSLFILFSPTPNSRAHCEAREWLQNFETKIGTDHFWLHRLLFSIYFPEWRGYIVSLERRFLDPANEAFATFINESLNLGYDALSSLKRTEGRFLQIPTMLEAAKDALDELDSLLSSMPHLESSHTSCEAFKNQRRRCVSYSRTASQLQQRVQSVAGLLADTLLLRDQILTKEQNQQIFQLNKSAFILTAFTLFYLPSSFLATIFGMNFFGMDKDNNRIVATPMIWIFFLSATLLTVVTFLMYYWLRRSEGSVIFKLIKSSEGFLQALRSSTKRGEKCQHSEGVWFQAFKRPLRRFTGGINDRQDYEA